MRQAVIFDLDGTLWDATKQIVPAWNTVFGRHADIAREVTEEEMHGYMGKTIEEIAAIALPDKDSTKAVSVLMECCAEQNGYLREKGGMLYPNLIPTLCELKKRYDLCVVSNCVDGYLQAFMEYHKMQNYFMDFEMSGRTGKPKGDNIRLIMERNGIGQVVYVGDTQSDMEAADRAGIPFIYAEYGFGKVDRTVPKVKCVSELLEAVPKIFMVSVQR